MWTNEFDLLWRQEVTYKYKSVNLKKDVAKSRTQVHFAQLAATCNTEICYVAS